MAPTRFCVLLLVLLGLCASDFRAAPTDCAFCGTWLLVERIDRTASGETLAEPSLGSAPLGILIYDRAGYVSAQLMKRDRTGAAAVAQPSQAQVSNNSAVTGGYDAYFGKYEVDAGAHIVKHHVEAAMAPDDVGKTLVRSYELSGSELHISFETTNNGIPVRRSVRWRRAA